MRHAGWAALVALDLIALLYLAGSARALAAFLAFVVFVLLPALALAYCAIHDVTGAFVAIVLLAVPWYFVRQAIGMSGALDILTAAALTFLGLRGGPL